MKQDTEKFKKFSKNTMNNNENLLRKNVPYYINLRCKKKEIWHNKEKTLFDTLSSPF
jgi:hypothetical protein